MLMYAIRRSGISMCGKTEKRDIYIPNVLVAYIHISKNGQFWMHLNTGKKFPFWAESSNRTHEPPIKG